MSVSAVSNKTNTRQASHKRNQAIIRIVATVLLSLGSLLVLFPLVWMLSTALKSDAEVMINSSLIPRDWRFDNFAKAWNSAPFMMYLKNTIFVTVIGMFGTVCSCSVVAYGFAKIRFKGRDIIFLCVLGTMMIPGMVTMVPTYVMYSKLGWVGTFLPLTVSNFFGSAYYCFLLRQSFKADALMVSNSQYRISHQRISVACNPQILQTCHGVAHQFQDIQLRKVI